MSSSFSPKWVPLLLHFGLLNNKSFVVFYVVLISLGYFKAINLMFF
ncbi:hypothetical protein [Aquirufa salirivi]